MFSHAIKHINDSVTSGTKFLVSRVMGNVVGTIKPVRKHYDIATSYTIHEGNGNTPTMVNANFPSAKYDALDYTPTWEHHRFVGWYSSPYDAEIEYLESTTDGQYIDAGVTFDRSYDFEVSADCCPVVSTRSVVCGTYSGASNTAAFNLEFGGSDNGIERKPRGYVDLGSGPSDLRSSAVSLNDIRTISVSYRSSDRLVTLKSGDETMTGTVVSGTGTGANTLWLFNDHRHGGMHKKVRIRSVTVKKNNVLAVDLHAVRIGTTGAMYDKVSGVTYWNAGPGSFTKGPDTSSFDSSEVLPSDTVVFDYPVIYARWQLPTAVTFDATTNGGQMPSGWTSPDYYEGQPYGTLPTPTKSGEAFLGWFTSGGTRVTTSSAVSAGTLTARYAAVTWATTYSCTTTSTYKNTGIYAASRYSSSDPIVVDWGDGTTDVVYGNISQLAHTYSSVTTYTVKISDNISTFCPSYSNSTWYQTTSQNQYTFKKVLTLSSRVTQLSAYAFYYCSAMTDAIIPSGATSIPTYCFYYCTQLKSSSVQLPSTVTSIGSYAFYNCSSSNFSSITIPAACTSIGSYAFGYCYYLHPVFEAGSATLTLNTYSFAYCFYQSAAVGTIDLSPRKITSIPNYCFYYCRYLKGITWPQGLTSIGGYAFRYCFYYAASTGTVKIPEGVTSISSNYAFGNCPYLTAVTLPSTLTNLNNYTFYYCTRLATITSFRSTAPTVYSATFGNSNTYYTGRNSYSAGTNKLYVPAGATGYNASYWSSVLLDSTKCGFTLEEMA